MNCPRDDQLIPGLPKGNAITLLGDDHERVRRLVGEFIQCRDRNETALGNQLAGVIADEVEINSIIKSEIFYPAARQVVDESRLIDESEIEQEAILSLVKKMRAMQPTDPKWYASMAVLGRYFRQHSDDEERELFWAMRKSGVDLEAMGERMLVRRREIDQQRGTSHPNSAEALPA